MGFFYFPDTGGWQMAQKKPIGRGAFFFAPRPSTKVPFLEENRLHLKKKKSALP